MFKSRIGLFVLNIIYKKRYPSAAVYWENRYMKNGNSGIGSSGILSQYKSDFLNKFIRENYITSVIEFGCGDGSQLKKFHFPTYVGLDVSVTAVVKCINIFKEDSTKSFFLYNPAGFVDNLKTFRADVALSLDVMYHLIEDETFESYVKHLFSSGNRFVVIYAWDVESYQSQHVRHRKFSNYIDKYLNEWRLIQTIKNTELPSACDFFIYRKYE